MAQLAAVRGLGGGGGGGFTLGPEQNVFTGANRAAAESARDTYFTANPSNLTEYNNDTTLNIRLEYTESSNNVALFQVRNGAGDAWLDNSSATGVPGQDGQDGAGIPITNVPASRVPMLNAARTEFVDSGIRQLGSGELLMPGDTGFEADSLRMGDISTIHEANSFLRLSNAQFPDVRFDLIDARSRPTAESNAPRQFYLTEAENDFTIQSVQTETITTNPLTVNYTATLDAQTNAFKFRTGATMSNVRITVSYATGNQAVIKYLPSKAAVLDGTGGYDFVSGDNTVSFPDSPFRQFNGDQVTVLLEADSVSFLGNTSDFPYLVAVVQRGEFRDLAFTQDVGVTVQDEGTGLTTLATTLNFTGSAVTASGTGATKTITITGGGGDPLTIQDEGTNLTTAATTLNFVGAGVTASGTGAVKTITISGGGTTPGPGPNDLRYGLSTQSDPALVDFASLTDVASPTDPQTVSTGTTTAGQYFHIFSANTHDIQTITDTVLQQVVYQDGGTGNIFTKVSDARTESSVTYDAYTIGPLNAGVDEDYVLAFS